VIKTKINIKNYFNKFQVKITSENRKIKKIKWFTPSSHILHINTTTDFDYKISPKILQVFSYMFYLV
jgi:hypothetical protein